MNVEVSECQLSAVPARSRQVKLSEALWGLDLNARLPLQVSADGVWVRLGGPADLAAFYGENHDALFGASGDREFLCREQSPAKARYINHVCDVLVFQHEERIVGAFVGNPVDWSTYYIRSTAFLAQYQGRALYRRFLDVLFGELAAVGVQRVEAETAPSNLQCVSALMRQHFAVSGTVLSEQWGALTRFTKHLDESARTVFVRQFCRGGEVHALNGGRRH